MKFDPVIAGTGLPAFPPRPAAGHKGTFGKVAVVGGSLGMSGAVCLSSVAALRTGSGRIGGSASTRAPPTGCRRSAGRSSGRTGIEWAWQSKRPDGPPRSKTAVSDSPHAISGDLS